MVALCARWQCYQDDGKQRFNCVIRPVSITKRNREKETPLTLTSIRLVELGPMVTQRLSRKPLQLHYLFNGITCRLHSNTAQIFIPVLTCVHKLVILKLIILPMGILIYHFKIKYIGCMCRPHVEV